MTIFTDSMVAHMHGDLTHLGVTDNIVNSLAVSLLKIESRGGNSISIDCKKVTSADVGGLRLLYVWMHCARFRGVEPVLVNITDSLKKTMRKLKIEHCFKASSLVSA